MSKLYKWFDENIGFGGLFIIFTGLSVVWLMIVIFVKGISGVAENDKHIAYLKTRIGDKYIVNKDTLLVLEFDTYNSKYLLSSGFYVSPEIIYKSKKVK